jgi:signal transduction histidine kinase
VSNALKFTPKGGVVTVSVSVLPVSLLTAVHSSPATVVTARNGDRFELQGAISVGFRDTGIGVERVYDQ